MVEIDKVLSLAFKYGYRKDAMNTLLEYYGRKGYPFEIMEKLIIEQKENDIFKLLFLNMGYINPIIFGKRHIDKINEYKDDYLAVKIIVTSDGADIIFTSQYAGYNFSSPVVNNASDDLAGVVVNTTANISPLVWCSISQVAA